MRKIREACCPKCERWSEVAWSDKLPPGGWWWKASGCCPKCDEAILVESECEFRIREGSAMSLLDSLLVFFHRFRCFLATRQK